MNVKEALRVRAGRHQLERKWGDVTDYLGGPESPDEAEARRIVSEHGDELRAAFVEVARAAGEKLKWDALEPSVVDMERRVGALFRSQLVDVKKAVASSRSKWPRAEEAAVRESPLSLIVGAIVARALVGRLAGDAERLRPPMEVAMTAALHTIGKGKWGISFTLEDVRATAYMKKRGAELVREMNRTTVADMRGILSRGISAGWSYDRVAKEIIAKYSSYSVARGQRGIRTRAHLIAVTENAFAYEHSHLEQAKMLAAAGLPMLKEWGVSGDERDCEICEGNAGDGAIPLAQSFGSGDVVPPAHPACRCWSETYVDPSAEVPADVTVKGQTVNLAL